MSRLQLLLDDNKARDLLKCGFTMDKLTDLALEITDIEDHEDLNPDFCYRLHRKYEAPLDAIKTLVSRAIFYLKNEEHAHSSPSKSHQVDKTAKSNDSVTVANTSGRSSIVVPQDAEVLILTSSDSEDNASNIRETSKKASSADHEKEEMDSEEEENRDSEEEAEDESDCEVVDILDHFEKDGVKSYRVQWKTVDGVEDWSDEENWVKETNMNCPELVEKYEAKRRQEHKEKQQVLSKKALHAKRVREIKEKIRLKIAEDTDICTSSDESNVGPVKRMTVNGERKIKRSLNRRKACHNVSASESDSSDAPRSTKKVTKNKTSLSKPSIRPSHDTRKKRIPKRSSAVSERAEPIIHDVFSDEDVISSHGSRRSAVMVSVEDFVIWEAPKISLEESAMSYQPSTSKAYRGSQDVYQCARARPVPAHIPTSDQREQKRKHSSHSENVITSRSSHPANIITSDEDDIHYVPPVKSHAGSSMSNESVQPSTTKFRRIAHEARAKNGPIIIPALPQGGQKKKYVTSREDVDSLRYHRRASASASNEDVSIDSPVKSPTSFVSSALNQPFSSKSRRVAHGSSVKPPPLRVPRCYLEEKKKYATNPEDDMDCSTYSSRASTSVSRQDVISVESPVMSPTSFVSLTLNQSAPPADSRFHRVAHSGKREPPPMLMPTALLTEQKKRKPISHPEDVTTSRSPHMANLISSDEDTNNQESSISPHTDRVTRRLSEMTVLPLVPVHTNHEHVVSDETMKEWTEVWYAQAESGETRALERNLKPHRCILYQKNTDPHQYGRCLFVFVDADNEGELKGDFIPFPFAGEHADRMKTLLNDFLDHVEIMGLGFELHLQKKREEFRKQMKMNLKKEY